jgi:hypothetical protein
VKDWSGHEFGYWTVIRHSGADKGRNRLWVCRCVCGNEKLVGIQHLKSGASKSCGCKSGELRCGKLSGDNNYSWKGGGKNNGSLAWCNRRLDSLRQGRKKWGGAEIVSVAEDVQELWKESRGVCVVCGCEPGRGKYHLDHQKSTGVVRGFLCGRCNVALGMAGDSPSRLRKLAEYLEARNQ